MRKRLLSVFVFFQEKKGYSIALITSQYGSILIKKKIFMIIYLRL